MATNQKMELAKNILSCEEGSATFVYPTGEHEHLAIENVLLGNRMIAAEVGANKYPLPYTMIGEFTEGAITGDFLPLYKSRKLSKQIQAGNMPDPSAYQRSRKVIEIR